MYYLYFVCTFQTITLNNGKQYSALSNGTLKLRYPIGDFESLMRAENVLTKDALLKVPDAKSLSLTITSYQHISTSPW